MIKVQLKKDVIKISGHAMYEDAGKDIICASVSSIVTTTINAIIRFDKESIMYDEKNGITIKLLKHTKENETLIENMIALLEELETDYPKNIKIYREV